MVDNYRQAEKCIKNATNIYMRGYDVAMEIIYPAAEIDVYELWIEIALIMGNSSVTYKGCFPSTEGSLF